MSKTTKTYWNPLNLENSSKWEIIENSKGMLEKLTLSIDEIGRLHSTNAF